jgi:MoaA/NifB/PqqE/SkfB family radical SAM enzyme
MDPRARALNLALAAEEEARGATRLRSWPAEIQIEATNRCHRSCPTCARHYYDRAANPPGDFTAALLDRVAPLFAYAERVLVGGYGEPLLAPITPTIIARAHDAGCRTELVTSGADFDDDDAARLAQAGLDELILSVDGADDDSLRRWRGLTWREIEATILAMRRHQPGVVTAFNVTLHVNNLPELPDLVARAAALSVATIAVFHQKLYTRTQAANSVLRLPEFAQTVFARAEDIAARAGVTLDLPPLGGERTCRQPYRLLAVRHDGLVQGCCSALFESSAPRVVLGRVPPDDWFELWNAPPMVAARAWSQGRGPDDFPCARCAFRVFTVAAHQRFLDGSPDD